jgi:peptidoglycan/LPS O-acetylase OafA/YrhL
MNQSVRILPLDGLRAIAITLVVLNHYFLSLTFRGSDYLKPIFHLGWTGVDLFFVLSGFLVGGILLQNKAATNLLPVFFARRALRILVPYFLFLIGAIVTTYCFHIPFSAYRWIPFALQLQPWYFAITNDFPILYLSPTWTLGLEECFYVLLPIALLTAREETIIRFSKIGIFAFPLLRLALYSYSEKFYSFCMVLRPEGLLMGLLLAHEWRSGDMRQRLAEQKLKLQVMWAVTGAFSILTCHYQKMFPTHYTMAVLYTFTACFYCTSVILVLLADPKALIARFLSSEPMRYIGQISYMIYLLHMLVYFWVTELTTDYSVPGGIKCGLITLGLSALSWSMMEQKLIKFGHTFQYITKPKSSNPTRLKPSLAAN